MSCSTHHTLSRYRHTTNAGQTHIFHIYIYYTYIQGSRKHKHNISKALEKHYKSTRKARKALKARKANEKHTKSTKSITKAQEKHLKSTKKALVWPSGSNGTMCFVPSHVVGQHGIVWHSMTWHEMSCHYLYYKRTYVHTYLLPCILTDVLTNTYIHKYLQTCRWHDTTTLPRECFFSAFLVLF